MGTVLTILDWAVRGVGIAGCGGSLYLLKNVIALRSANCDLACAKAVLPAGAFKDKVVWITGASSGIGAGLAKHFAIQGAKIVASSRNQKDLEEMAKGLETVLKCSGGEIAVFPLDLADLESLSGKAKEAHKLFGRPVDILVNNGGYSSRAFARETPGYKQDAAMMDVNYLSCVALAKEVLPALSEKRPVLIINISSLAGKFGVALRSMYSGVKFALIGWFDALRLEEVGFYDSGVQVLNVCPGSVQTNVSKNAVLKDGSKLGHTDPNIQNGLEVDFVCERILAAADCGLYEVWIAKWTELRLAYVAQYMPDKAKKMLLEIAPKLVSQTMGEEFAQAALKNKF